MPRRQRGARKHHPKFFVDPEHGCLRPMIPTMSSWWILYVQNPNPECKKWSNTFRSRFRLPYTSFVDLLNALMLDRTDIILAKWRPTLRDGTTTPFPHVYGRSKISPVPLLLMGIKCFELLYGNLHFQQEQPLVKFAARWCHCHCREQNIRLVLSRSTLW